MGRPSKQDTAVKKLQKAFAKCMDDLDLACDQIDMMCWFKGYIASIAVEMDDACDCECSHCENKRDLLEYISDGAVKRRIDTKNPRMHKPAKKKTTKKKATKKKVKK